MQTDRELRTQIEEAEARLRTSRQRLLEERATFSARTTALELDRRTLTEKLSGLGARMAEVKAALEKANEAVGEVWAQAPVELVTKNDKGEDLTVIDGLFNALFGQTPDWARGQPFTRRLLIRFQQGRGRRQ